MVWLFSVSDAAAAAAAAAADSGGTERGIRQDSSNNSQNNNNNNNIQQTQPPWIQGLRSSLRRWWQQRQQQQQQQQDQLEEDAKSTVSRIKQIPKQEHVWKEPQLQISIQHPLTTSSSSSSSSLVVVLRHNRWPDLGDKKCLCCLDDSWLLWSGGSECHADSKCHCDAASASNEESSCGSDGTKTWRTTSAAAAAAAACATGGGGDDTETTTRLVGTWTRRMERHVGGGVNVMDGTYRLELDDPSIASALLMDKLNAGEYFMKRLGPKWLDRIASRFLSRKSRSAIVTIIDIVQSFEDHGVVDVFAKYSQGQIFWALVALSGLQKTMQAQGLLDQYLDTVVTVSSPPAPAAPSLALAVAAKDNTTPHGNDFISLTNLPEVHDPVLFDQLAHYAVYASAAYGWKLGLAMKGTSFLSQIRRGHTWNERRRRRRRRRPQQKQGQNGGSAFWKKAVGNGTMLSISDMSFFLQRTGRAPLDIVAAEWESDTHRPGYVIARDPTRKAVVFSIRGTWSFHDFLTDLCCTTQDFSIGGGGAAAAAGGRNEHSQDDPNQTTASQRPPPSSNGGSVHVKDDDDDDDNEKDDFSSSLIQRLWNWFYASSKTKSSRSSSWSRKQKEDAIHSAHHGMLEAAQELQNSTQRALDEEFRQNPDYCLVIVGHSMGGGVAALLGTLWSERYPQVSVFVYGPPCIAPLDATPLVGSKATNIVSVITEGDPFGFISLGHIAELSVALDRLCADKNLRERVLQSTLFRREKGDKKQKHDSWWLLHTMRYLHANFTGEKLYPPGRLLLLKQSGPRKQQQQRRRRRQRRSDNRIPDNSIGNRWTMRSVPPQYFSHFQVRPAMLDLGKHVPSLYEEILWSLAEKER